MSDERMSEEKIDHVGEHALRAELRREREREEHLAGELTIALGRVSEQRVRAEKAEAKLKVIEDYLADVPHVANPREGPVECRCHIHMMLEALAALEEDDARVDEATE